MGSFTESKARAFVVFGLFTVGVFALTGASGLRAHDDPGWGGGHDRGHGDETCYRDHENDHPDENNGFYGDDGCDDSTTATTTTTTSTTTTSTTTTSTTTTTTTTTSTTTTSAPPTTTTTTTTTSAPPTATTAPTITTTTTTTTAPAHHANPTTPTTPPLSFTFEVQGSGADGSGGAGPGGGASGGGASGGDLALGEQITVTGHDLPPGSDVKVEIHSAVRLLGWSVVKGDGTFTLTTVIPADLAPGAHTIVVTVYPPAGAPAQESLTLPVSSGDLQQVVLGAFDPGTPPDVGAPAPIAAEPAPGPGLNDPTVFGTTLKTAADIHLTPSSAGVIGGIAAAFVLLFAFPAEILRLTFANNDARIRRMLVGAQARARRRAPRLMDDAAALPRGFRAIARRFSSMLGAAGRRVPALRSDWIQVLATAGVGAVILAFADPHFGFHGSSARLLLAMVLSILWVVVTMNTVVRLFAARRFHTVARFKTMPFALLFMLVGVIASRFTHSQPGFVIGLVMGVTYARELRHRDEAELALVGAGTFLGVGLISWFAFNALATGAAHGEAGFWVELFREVFAAGTLESFVALVVGLLPMTFLEGRPIFEWSRKVWAGVYAVCLVTFMVLVVPISGDFRETRGNLGLIVTGLLAFSGVALAIWYGFRVAERRDRAREAAARVAALAEAESASTSAARARARRR